jgi:hypothetical protein
MKLPKPHKKAMLPSREAVNQLTKGGPMAMSLNNYAKLTPSGAGATMTYDGITNMAKKGASAKSDG